MGKYPHVRLKGRSACHSDMECSHLPRSTHTDCGGVVLYLISKPIRNNSQCMRMFSLKQRGVYVDPQTEPLTVTEDSKNM